MRIICHMNDSCIKKGFRDTNDRYKFLATINNVKRPNC